MVEVIIGAVAANSFVLVVLAFLFRTVIKHWIDKDIKSFKTNLEYQAKSQLAEYQSKLEEERIRLKISYGGIFEKQAQTILTLFQFIVEIERTINQAIYDQSEKKEEYTIFINKWSEFYGFYEINKILLPESIEKLFEKLLDGAYSGVSRYRSAAARIDSGQLRNEQFERYFNLQDKAEEVIKQIPEIKIELTNKLRSLIGVVG